MKRSIGINCIELGTGANYILPPEDADPNKVNQITEVKVYKLNPDGTKGEFLRIEPAFPEGWDNPRKILPGLPKKKEEDEEMTLQREDKAEKLVDAKKLIAAGTPVLRVAKEIGIPQSTLVTWLKKDSKGVPPGPQKDYFGTPILEVEVAREETPDGFTDKVEKPIPYQIVEALKIKFANLTLEADLPDWMKLSIIESIVRM